MHDNNYNQEKMVKWEKRNDENNAENLHLHRLASMSGAENFPGDYTRETDEGEAQVADLKERLRRAE